MRYIRIIRYEIENQILRVRGRTETVVESLIALKRAGSNAIVTYFALEIANQLK